MIDLERLDFQVVRNAHQKMRLPIGKYARQLVIEMTHHFNVVIEVAGKSSPSNSLLAVRAGRHELKERAE